MTPFYGPPCIIWHCINGDGFDSQLVGQCHWLLLSDNNSSTSHWEPHTSVIKQQAWYKRLLEVYLCTLDMLDIATDTVKAVKQYRTNFVCWQAKMMMW